LTAVFGVNDEVYRSIDELGEAQDKLQEKTAHQSNLFLSTIQEVNTNTNKQIMELGEKISQGINQINSMQAWHSIMDKQKVNYHMMAVSRETENAMQQIAAKYDVIIKAITNRGSILDFITYYELKQTLDKISSKLPQEIEIEHKPVEDTQFTANNEELVIHGFLNLREKARYKLLAATAIPKRVNADTLATTATSTKLIAIDYNGQKYFNTSIAEMEKCTKKPKNLHNCIITSVHDLEKDDNCMLNQILNRKSSWTCHVIRFTTTKPLWIQLTMENTWLLITTKPTRIAVNCNGVRKERTLNTTAIIKIKNGCIIKTGNLIILSRQKDVLKVKGTYHKAIQIDTSASDTETPAPDTIIHTISPIIKLEQPFLPNFEKEEYHVTRRRHPIETHSTMIIVAVIIVIGLIGTWIFRGKLWSLIMTTCCNAAKHVATKVKDDECVTEDIQTDALPGNRTWTITG